MENKNNVDLISKPKLIKKGNLYLESLGGALNGISNYIPSSISGFVAEKKTPEIEKPIFSLIERCNFGTLKHPNNKICLFLSFTSGIQIWDLSSSENGKDNSNYHQIFSLKINNIKFVKFLPPPEIEDDEKSPFYQKRPLIIMSSGSKFVIFSLKTNTEIEVNQTNLNNPIISIYANSSIILLATKNRIYLFDSNTFDLLQQRDIFESLVNDTTSKPPIAFGERWYAIPSPLALPELHSSDLGEESKKEGTNHPQKKLNGGNTTSTSPTNSNNSTLSYLTSTLYNWGDIGREKLQNYIYDQKEEKPTAGLVQIFDCKTDQNISHFKAHKHKLTHMVFDKSGTLLVTSSDGHNINVFRILRSSSPYTSHAHLYSLRRGFTNAKIHSIIFTDDSRWISVSSARGTNHIYPINLVGGQANEKTHIFYSPLSTFIQTMNNESSTLAVNSSCRIKQEVGIDNNFFSFPLHASFFIRPSNSTLSALSLNNNPSHLLNSSTTPNSPTSPSATSVLSLLTFNPFGFITEHVLTVKSVENVLDVQYENFREWKFSFFEKKRNGSFPEVNKVDLNVSDNSNLFYQYHFLQHQKKTLENNLKKDKHIHNNEDNLSQDNQNEEKGNIVDNVDHKILSTEQEIKQIDEKLSFLSPLLNIEKEKIWKSRVEVKTFSHHKDLIWSSRQFKFFSVEQMTPQEKDFYQQSQKFYNNSDNNSLNNASFLESFSNSQSINISNNNTNNTNNSNNNNSLIEFKKSSNGRKSKGNSPRSINEGIFPKITDEKMDNEDEN